MNMHSNKLVVAIKNKGKVLREFKDQIRIPFGSEYSVYIKNLNSVRALIKIEIDGKDIGDGTRFIVHPNSDIDIERFLASGNLNEGNRFKFIERTSKIEENRGVGAEDGLIRVEFQFEKPVLNDYKKVVEEHHYHHYPKYGWSNDVYYNSASPSSGLLRSRGITNTSYTMGSASASASVVGESKATYSANNISCSGMAAAPFSAAPCDTQSFVSNSIMDSMPLNENGITVQGSVSEQKFQLGAWFATETEKHVIVLKMVGELESGKPVVEAVTVKTKPKCVTCGHTNKATAKFCAECGTSLHIV